MRATTHYSLLTTHYSLHYSLLTTHCSLLTTRHSLLTTHHSLLTTHYSEQLEASSGGTAAILGGGTAEIFPTPQVAPDLSPAAEELLQEGYTIVDQGFSVEDELLKQIRLTKTNVSIPYLLLAT